MELAIISPILVFIAGIATIAVGRRTNKETNLAQLLEFSDERTNRHIDQLQEDLDRYRNMARETQGVVDQLREQLREEIHARRNAEAAAKNFEEGNKKAYRKIHALEDEKRLLEEHVEKLEHTIKTLKTRQINE